MKVVFAPNAFKESLDALSAARAMARGWKRARPRDRLIIAPVADGGDGTAQAFAAASGGRMLYRTVRSPLNRSIRAGFAWNEADRTAVIEMALAAGLALVPPRLRNPMKTTTFGVGQLANAAIRLGARRVVIGLGGSATVDGGAGFAQALGYRLLDRRGRPIGPGGRGLEMLHSIEPPPKRPWESLVKFVAATDVTNPLLGKAGAAAVFGPQKGATSQQVQRLEAALANMAAIIDRDLGLRVAKIPGAGAAGGFGAGLAGFCQAQVESGAGILMRLSGFETKLKKAGLAITGEGRLDEQTQFGKAPMEVARLAERASVPVIGVAGALGPRVWKLLDNGFGAVFSIADGPISLEDSMRRTEELLEQRMESIGRIWNLGAALRDNLAQR